MEPILTVEAEFAFLGLMLASTVGHIIVLNRVIELQMPYIGRLKAAMSFIILSMWVLIARIFVGAIISPSSGVLTVLDIIVVGTFAAGILMHTWVFISAYYLRKKEGYVKVYSSVPTEIDARIRGEATRRGLNKADLIREALIEKFGQEGAQQ